MMIDEEYDYCKDDFEIGDDFSTLETWPLKNLNANVKSTFKKWDEAARYAYKKKLWGKVTVIQTNKNEYVLVDKE